MESNNQVQPTVALSDSAGRCLNRAEFNQLISTCTEKLNTAGIRKNDRIVLLLEKNFLSISFIHAISDLHATYIPIDPEWPDNRISAILDDCTPRLVIHNNHPLFNSDADGVFDTGESGVVKLSFRSEYTAADSSQEELAYILYTSGSTGKPKGVCVSREAQIAFTTWCIQTFGITAEEKIASVAPLHFDISICDVFASRQTGCSLHLFKKNDVSNARLVAQQLSTSRITFVYATPTFFSNVLYYGKPEKYVPYVLRCVLFAGEVFSVKPLHELMNLWAEAEFFNLYGPTETNVVTFNKIHQEADRTTPYPIGNICSGHEFRIADDGELLAGGPHVASGYLNLQELSEEKFFEREGKRWFKTGDIVQLDPSEKLQYVQRKDRMIKRRGYRIEPGEIETAALQISGVNKAACISRTDSNGETIICLFTEGQYPDDLLRFRAALLNHLPAYMMPDIIILNTELPVTSTGKIDYSTLKSTPVK